MSSNPDCHETCYDNPAYAAAEAALADAQAAESEAQAALDAINATLEDARAKEAARQEMSAQCQAVRESIESIGNTVMPAANWAEFEENEKCINETYANALANFITEAENEQKECQRALEEATKAREQAERTLAATPKIICETTC